MDKSFPGLWASFTGVGISTGSFTFLFALKTSLIFLIVLSSVTVGAEMLTLSQHHPVQI